MIDFLLRLLVAGAVLLLCLVSPFTGAEPSLFTNPLGGSGHWADTGDEGERQIGKASNDTGQVQDTALDRGGEVASDSGVLAYWRLFWRRWQREQIVIGERAGYRREV